MFYRFNKYKNVTNVSVEHYCNYTKNYFNLCRRHKNGANEHSVDTFSYAIKSILELLLFLYVNRINFLFIIRKYIFILQNNT